MSHMFFNVPLMYQVSKLQLSAHRTTRNELSPMFSRGLRPVKQCRKIVKVNTATEQSDAAMSCMQVSLIDSRAAMP